MCTELEGGGFKGKKVELENNFSKRNPAAQRNTVACYTGSHDWKGLEKFFCIMRGQLE